MTNPKHARLKTDGKFFLRRGARVSINAVTYGPFPDPRPNAAQHLAELERIAKAGFNAIRIYEEPSQDLLDAAIEHDLMVFAGIHWPWDRIFRGVGYEKFFTEAQLRIAAFLKNWGQHPAIAAFYVANEIRPDIARWIGPVRTKESLEELIELAKELAPHLLVAYANYPSSEYLEPANADFTGFNLYLEKKKKFKAYLQRLHHIAGDRPVLLSEIGIDSQHHGEKKQAEILAWSRQFALDAGMAGTTVFAWSDNWRVGSRTVTDWDFGLTRRDGSKKPALKALKQCADAEASEFPYPIISVIICVYNGVDRVWKTVESLRKVNYPADKYEVIVVDDGSTDGTQERVSKYLRNFPQLQLICAKHGGLSKARNLGASKARGSIFAFTDDDCEVDRDWLYWIARGYHELGVEAMGGPNIPPVPEGEDEAIVAAAPGAPSHVMLSDRIAEHIPGCNLTVSRFAFKTIDGFRPTYRVAGDDVDFCWRLEAAGFKIGFHGAAFVWHRRRTSFFTYFKQQKGYGKAEALLMRDHPEKFTRGNGASWKGCVYTGNALGAHDGSFIYVGAAGNAPFQQVTTHMMPTRRLHPHFCDYKARLKLRIATRLQPLIRRWARWYFSRKWQQQIPVAKETTAPQPEETVHILKESGEYTKDANARQNRLQHYLDNGWTADHPYSEWDLVKANKRILLALEMVGNELWMLRERHAEIHP